MTLNDFEPPPPKKRGVIVNFSQFLAEAHISTVNCDKMAGDINQDNLHMEFLALNVDFSSFTPNPLSLRRPAHAGVKEGYLLSLIHI